MCSKTQLFKPFQTPLEICADIRTSGVQNDVCVRHTYYYLKYVLIFEVKSIFSKKATKIDKIYTIDLTLTTQRQIDGNDFVNFCGLLRKHKL